jgi:2-oxoglutarate/2-oxoacid ferredoxin oxidoreductase subunit beta
MITNRIAPSEIKLAKEDFVSDQMVKWCPGCGAHAILKAVENVFPEIGYKKENFVFVSGIGCSSRFPYYVNTYGFHGIHGRAMAIATGVKLSNPDLSVWIATGDGDSMAIGGNHFIHIIRRNLDVNILLFNNQIYGLTKGQYSPTTPIGTVTKTSPHGTIEHPFVTAGLVMGAQGTFFARVLDSDIKMMTSVMHEAARHDGTSVIEILQNCIIFADKTHRHVTEKEVRDDFQLRLRHGEPMLYGRNNEKGIQLKGTKLQGVVVGLNGVTIEDILVHDQYEKNPGIHRMLGKMGPPDLPVALGVIRSAEFETYDDMVEVQIAAVKENSKIKCMDDLLKSGETFYVE